MSLHLSGAPNGLPWLADDNVVKWQVQVMAYLCRKELTQYMLGSPCAYGSDYSLCL